MKKILSFAAIVFAWLPTQAMAGALAGDAACENNVQVANVSFEADPKPEMIIIIDDLGHSLYRGKKAIELPGNLTYAVIPFTHYARELAERAHQHGKEVMVHAPMSTVDGAPLGVGGLTAQLSRTEFNTRLNEALAEVPHAQGINNHMGSDLTQRRMQMGWLMQELRWQELYFVDSRTSGRSVAATVATEFNVPNLSREIFLDNELDTAAIARQFAQARALAKKLGRVVVIGHPHPETITYLNEALPALRHEGIELLTVSQALRLSDQGPPAFVRSRAASAQTTLIDTPRLGEAGRGCGPNTAG